jgi:hypothetical protein
MQEDLHKRPFGWLKGQWHRLWGLRVGKNSVLSVLAWCLMYGLFFVEVSQLDWKSQHAKLAWSLMGLPLGVAIQCHVFWDKLQAMRTRAAEWTSIWKILWAAAKLVSKWGAVRFLFFLLNQTCYAVLLHRAGLPYWAAALLIAPILSILYFFTNALVVFVVGRGAPQIETP